MMAAWRRRVACAACAAGLLLTSGALSASEQSRAPAVPTLGSSSSADESADRKARDYFTDRRVVTQRGETLQFYSDVLEGRTVVVTLFFAGCTGVCPVNNEKLAELQSMLGEAMGRDVFFVSVTVDPEHDSVDALAQYAAKFGAGPGWVFLTGAKEDIDVITRRLGHTSDVPDDHVTFFMIGNVPKAHWRKVPPYEPAEVILHRLQGIMSASGADLPAGGVAAR
jgi:protein SCO1/2